jgi:hypothetical protein
LRFRCQSGSDLPYHQHNGDNDAIASPVDFLMDLQHFCHLAHAEDAAHLTFDEALESERGHLEAEQNGEKQAPVTICDRIKKKY